jgi:molybdopterin/thiamine biosynthesis adenylyltransferase
MALVLALGAGLWGFGHLMRAPIKARLAMLGLLYLAVLLTNTLLPQGHPIANATGGSAGEWLVVGGLAAAVWIYTRGLAVLRRRVRPENAARTQSAPPQLDPQRHARHIVLREIGGQGQQKLAAARVLVIGAGGLGSPVLMYLAAAGVGTIGVIDDDVVDLSNLQRQIIHTDAQIGMPKVFSAEAAMKALNPGSHVRPYHRRLKADIARDLLADYDLVLDGTDDVATRYLVNDTAAALGIPLISGAISQWEGQVSTFAPKDGTPCYACVFPDPAAPGLAPSCAEGGVVGPLPGVIGSIMALEAIKEITGAGESLRGRMLIHDALWGEHRTITLKRRADCLVCSDLPAGGAAS